MEKIVIFQDRAGWADLFSKFGAQDDVPDGIEDDIPTVADRVWQAGPIQAALKSSSGASVVLDLSVPTDDVDDDGEFYKLPVIVKTASASSSALGKRTRPEIAKTVTRTDEDGFRWFESYDATGALLDTRVLLSDTEEI